MKDIKEIPTFEVSRYINFFRQELLKERFFEHTLYSTIPYRVSHTNSFALPHGLFLRYGTEPDIWKVGSTYSRFFFIGSLFRNEPKQTRIHNYEFKIIDYYLRGGSAKRATAIFFQLLKKMELDFGLPKLSKRDIVYITHENFRKWKEARGWIVVTDYPINESFYDVRSGDKTKKFEILFRGPEETIEVASAGIVGPNLNKHMNIKSDQPQRYKKIFQKKFIGLGFGMERLIYLYRVNQ